MERSTILGVDLTQRGAEILLAIAHADALPTIGSFTRIAERRLQRQSLVATVPDAENPRVPHWVLTGLGKQVVHAIRECPDQPGPALIRNPQYSDFR